MTFIQRPCNGGQMVGFSLGIERMTKKKKMTFMTLGDNVIGCCHWPKEPGMFLERRNKWEICGCFRLSGKQIILTLETSMFSSSKNNNKLHLYSMLPFSKHINHMHLEGQTI